MEDLADEFDNSSMSEDQNIYSCSASSKKLNYSPFLCLWKKRANLVCYYSSYNPLGWDSKHKDSNSIFKIVIISLLVGAHIYAPSSEDMTNQLLCISDSLVIGLNKEIPSIAWFVIENKTHAT